MSNTTLQGQADGAQARKSGHTWPDLLLMLISRPAVAISTACVALALVVLVTVLLLMGYRIDWKPLAIIPPNAILGERIQEAGFTNNEYKPGQEGVFWIDVVGPNARVNDVFVTRDGSTKRERTGPLGVGDHGVLFVKAGEFVKREYSQGDTKCWFIAEPKPK